MDENGLITHHQINHPGEPMKHREIEFFHKLSHVCDICDATFDTIMAANAHLASEHDNQYECEQCKMKFKKTFLYAKHLYDCVKRTNCLLCDIKVSTKDSLYLHYSSHLKSMRPFACDQPNCDRRFSNRSAVNNHILHSHTRERNYQCERCAKTFKTEQALKGHFLIHTDGPRRRKMRRIPSVCDVCGKTLSSVENLKFHMRTHTGYKPFQCDQCEKAFTKKELLVEHTRVHTGERPFPCEYCGKRFTQRSPLVIHVRGHTGERPYACDICESAFASRSTLNTHLKKCRGIK